MHVDLFFDLYFNFLSVKTEINKNNNERLNLINLDGSEALKRQIPATWSAMRLNHFEMMSFKQYFIGFWSYILTFQYFGIFDKFPWFPSFRFWVSASKRKPGNHGKSLVLGLQSGNGYGSIFRSLFQLSEC